MQRTENYRLFKPESTDNGSPEPFNSNADVVDAELNRLSTGLDRIDDEIIAKQAVLDSGITAAKVAKLDALPTSTQLDGSLSNKANKADITNISITGTTNNTGSKILTGTLFYLNGTLYKTINDVADGATFTEGTNCTQTDVSNTLVFIAKASDVRHSSSYTLDNVSTLTALYNQILVDYYENNRVSIGNIGNLDDTALKSVLPNPFENFTQVYCKVETDRIVAIYALGLFVGKLAKCYLFKDDTNILLTDWQVLK